MLQKVVSSEKTCPIKYDFKNIDGKYKVFNTIGKGASCKVKLGEHMSSGKQVAIKIINQEISSTVKEVVISETQQLKKVGHHKNITTMLHYGKGIYSKPGKEH